MKNAISNKCLGADGEEFGIADLLGPPPVLHGEDVAKFNQLQVRVVAAIKPRDAIEEIFARDIGDLTWEIARGRRLKASLLLACAHTGLRRVLTPLVGQTEAGQLSEAWAKGDVAAKTKVARHLAAAHLTIDAVTAETLALKLDQIERFEALIASGEARLAAALQEIDRHRDVCAELLKAVDDIVDAEFSPVEPQKGLLRGAA